MEEQVTGAEDEPTGELDSATAASVFGALQTANSDLAVTVVVRSEGVTALVATHDPALIDLADEVFHLEDGKITTS
jgi:putative ABC transport system ATP-binding protein